jgi:phosphoribosylaminoimidazolecarboxamide formyltransferase/IMP cyclohydrolase
MSKALGEKNVKVQSIKLKNRELSAWLKQEHAASAFGFDFDQCRLMPDKDTRAEFTRFVVGKSIERKLCLLDKSGLEIYKAGMSGTNEDIVTKVNKHTTNLALEEITHNWAETHLRRGKLQFAEKVFLSAELMQTLRYGENPQQIAALYRTDFRRWGVTTARQIQGKELSFNNINDTDAAYECVSEFIPKRTAACVIVKHANPCGVAEGDSLVEAYQRALRCDPISAFGGVVAVNRTLDAEAARAITEIFTEVIIAPDATEEAIDVVKSKKNLRLLLAGKVPSPNQPGVSIRSVAGGLLVQSRDNATIEKMQLKTVTKRSPTESELRDLRFAFRVVKHVKSNAIVYAKDFATVGIGAGQMSRVDSARLGAIKGRDAAKEAKLLKSLTKDSVVASDAFFPFADGLLVAIEAGARAVIQPGGSVRDDEVIRVADDHDVAMVFTDTRHFRH